MAIINNVTRFLDARKVRYRAWDLPAEKLGAVEAARFMGVPPQMVFKTIVVTRERGRPVLAVIPGPSRVDLKQLAATLGEKKVHLPSEREAERLTGLEAGGISPLALIHKGFQVVVDSAAQGYERIFVSGGQRGLNLEMSPAVMAGLCNAHFACISGEGD
jgi:Cys-tRNA(Pro)/Cys-tRNA(Cys) deacylase